MKYIITDKDEIRIGFMYHQDLADGCTGTVVRAGHCEQNADGSYRVWDGSIGFGIQSQPEDAVILENYSKSFKK